MCVITAFHLEVCINIVLSIVVLTDQRRTG